ncbi:MAG: T9SS type A sorting domain-containing protein [Lewinellaceae bacterium]|nr:T9SS type A sorting domain-containing protein [Lewinellaceae bacterium]
MRRLILLLAFFSVLAFDSRSRTLLLSPAKEWADPACRAEITLSLNANCQAILTPELVFSGDLSGEDLTDFLILVNDSNSANESIIDGPGQFSYEVIRKSTSTLICGGQVTSEDKSPPRILSHNFLASSRKLWCADLPKIANQARSWNDPTYRYFSGRPVWQDNCNGNVGVKVTDVLVYGDCDSTFFVQLHRTFRGTDQAGNFRDTTQILDFSRIDWAQVTVLPQWSAVTCSANTITAPVIYPYLIGTFLDTIRLQADGCFYSLAYRDDTLSQCAGKQLTIDRVWEVRDWCRDESWDLGATRIRIGDFQAPVVKGGLDTVTVSVGPMDCTAVLETTPAGLKRVFKWEATDNCGPVNYSYKFWQLMPAVAGFSWQPTSIIIDPSGMASRIPVGRYGLEVIVLDGCTQQTKDTLFFKVTDQVAPLMKCSPGLNVSLTNAGVNRVFVRDVDEGSIDNCGPLFLSIRREVTAACLDHFDQNGDGRLTAADGLIVEGNRIFTQPGNSVDVFCCDAGSKVTVELWGRDLAGNQSYCWTAVQVEDKNTPFCLAPSDTTILCTDAALRDYSLLGTAQVGNDPCGLAKVEVLPIINQLNSCGNGTITRRWQIVKYPGTPREYRSPVCEQVVTIQPVHAYEIRFPADTTLTCGSLPAADSLFYQELGCDILAVNVLDEPYFSEVDVCYKVFRNYTVINWCEYKESAIPFDLPRDVDGNNIGGDKPFWLLVRPSGNVYLDANRNETDSIPSSRGYWVSTLENAALRSNGYWKYTQVIKIVDNVAPQISTSSASYTFAGRYADCSGDINIPITIAEDCTPQKLEFTLELDRGADGSYESGDVTQYLRGNYPFFRIMARLPLGKYAIRTRVRDACGNASVKILPFEVVDTKAPSPVCISGLVVELTPLAPRTDIDGDGAFDPGAVVLWAEDMIVSAGAAQDCSGPVTYSIHRADLIESGKEKPTPQQKNIVLTCKDRPTVLVYVYAWDAKGNKSFCETYILVQDPRGLCTVTGTSSINGQILKEDGVPVSGVEVNLSGGTASTFVSGTDGKYSFTQLKNGNDFTVTPYLNWDHDNGVTTYDVVLITRHILGMQPFVRPAQFIAADVDRSGTVSTLDVIQIRKLILLIDREFKANTSWRFIDDSYRFQQPTNPLREPFPEVRNYNNLNAKIEQANFLAVKVGDVSGNANPANLRGDPETEANLAPVQLTLPDKTLAAGETVEIPIYLRPGFDLAGWQAGIQWPSDMVTVEKVAAGWVKEEHLGQQFQAEGYLLVSWNQTGERSMVTDDKPAFTLRIKALRRGNLRDWFTLAPRLVAGEAYSTTLAVYPLVLAFGEAPKASAPVVSGFTTYPAFPNPFQEQTTVPFYLPAMGEVKMEVHDLQGRLCWQKRWQAAEGYHQINLGPQELSEARGILLLTLTTPFGTQVQKISRIIEP